jgi:hypothetical protein
VSLQQLQQHTIGWQVAGVSDTLEDLFIQIVIRIIMRIPYVEETITSQAVGLMYLEAKTDLFHEGNGYSGVVT